MLLDGGNHGDEVVLDAVEGDLAPVRRMAELGLRPGARVRLLHRTAGGAGIVRVGTSRLAVGGPLLHRLGLVDGHPGPVVPERSNRVPRAGGRPSAAPGRERAAGSGRCHGVSSVGQDGGPVVALAGAPNVGKSSLFNALTGARHQVGNWPGTTVEVGRGIWRLSGTPGSHDGPDGVTLVDLPGAYSLDPQSPDEELTRALLVEVPAEERPDLVLVLVSAADPARGLYLLRQLLERTGVRALVVLTMDDLARRQGLRVDPQALRRAVGVPVVVVDPRRRRGLDGLAQSVTAALRSAPATAPCCTSLVDGDDDEFSRLEARFGWVERTVALATSPDPGHAAGGATRTDRLDRWLTSPGVGTVAFLAVMWCVFQVTTAVSAPMVDALDRLFTGPVARATTATLGAAGLSGTWGEGLVLGGLLPGVGTVLSFVPLMTMMFVLLAVLEDSGYLARAAVVADRAMRVVGLPGRAFVPLLIGFGCNVPAVSATRVLPDARHRLLTAMIVPFATCPARLPVYVLISAAMFGSEAGSVVFAMYVASIALIVGGGLLLRLTVFGGLRPEPLLLDLPGYQVPVPRFVAAVTWTRLAAFLRTAAGVIVATVAAVWLLTAVPARPGAGDFGRVAVDDSAFAAVSRMIAPVFAPAGFGDWHSAGALIVGSVAKEAVISSWAQTYATPQPDVTAAPDATARPGSLGDAVRGDFATSSGGHPRLAGLAFMLFVLGYAPCVATLTAQVREIGTRHALSALAVSLTTCWLVAVLVFQAAKALA